MQLRDLLSRRHIFVPLEATSLREALLRMGRELAESGAARDGEELERALRRRRLRDVVAVGEEAALPHFRTDAVDRLIVSIGVARQPLDAEGTSLDIQPRIVIFILAPPRAATLYLQTVSALARLLRLPDVVERIIEAETPDDVLLLPEFRETKVQPELTVRDVMSHGTDGIPPDTPVRHAIDLMVRRRLRVVPVVGDKREVLGVVSDGDVMRALLPQIPRSSEETAEEAASPRDLAVREIMSRSVLCISEDMSLTEAASMMINKDVEQFPVVGEGRLVGMLAREDIIRKLFGR
ncbi:MAG: CBS domain-containing protein [Gemmatimonadota bacterium]